VNRGRGRPRLKKFSHLLERGRGKKHATPFWEEHYAGPEGKKRLIFLPQKKINRFFLVRGRCPEMPPQTGGFIVKKGRKKIRLNWWKGGGAGVVLEKVNK